jgi:hypothetical protein
MSVSSENSGTLAVTGTPQMRVRRSLDRVIFFAHRFLLILAVLGCERQQGDDELKRQEAGVAMDPAEPVELVARLGLGLRVAFEGWVADVRCRLRQRCYVRFRVVVGDACFTLVIAHLCL